MVPIRVKMEDLDTTILPLGFLGENLHKEIIINCKQAFDLYPDAVPSLTVLMPDGYTYPAVIERQGEDIIWELTASDLSKVGAGEIQLSFVQDEVIMLSVAGHTYCSRAIVPKGAVPDPVANWILQAQQIIASIPGDINAALAAAKASGEFDGADGVGIVSITKIGSFGLVDTYRILLSNDNHYDYDVTNGAPGNDGVGIASIAKTGTVGLVDTYTITLTNGQQYDFTVTNGQDGSVPIDDTAGEGDTDKVWSADKSASVETEIKNAIALKQDAPKTAGTAGQIISLDSNLDLVWVDKDPVVNVSGTTPSITGVAGTRYICGEVSLLTIIVPSSGIIDVVFDSGSTATVLTVIPPTGQTMKWSNSFEPTNLDANTTYEINIANGCLGVAMKWT